MFRAILFDVIGTTVKETDPETINRCFKKAFDDHKVTADISLLKKNRGRDKKIIIENILQQSNLPVNLIDIIYTSFKINIINNIHNFSENDGAVEIFSYLKEKKIKTGIGTGLERDIFDAICHHLAWKPSGFDYIGISNEIGRSRPYPDMIIDMMRKLNITDPSLILKVGDTIADIQEGKNAKVFTAALLSGTQDSDDLLKEKPDYVLTSLAGIKEIIEEGK